MGGVLNVSDIDGYFWRAKRGMPPMFFERACKRLGMLEIQKIRKMGVRKCRNMWEMRGCLV